MTIVAGLCKDGETWLMADKLVSWGGFVREDLAEHSKILQFPNALIGVAGRHLFINALQYLPASGKKEHKDLINNPFASTTDVMKFFFGFYGFIKANYNL
ncbi:MAG: hypothetical protein KTR14_05070, partial [Vampirovibrio sp.]|nr:hypothetical protein [Vampirovibrio sp.]